MSALIFFSLCIYFHYTCQNPQNPNTFKTEVCVLPFPNNQKIWLMIFALCHSLKACYKLQQEILINFEFWVRKNNVPCSSLFNRNLGDPVSLSQPRLDHNGPPHDLDHLEDRDGLRWLTGAFQIVRISVEKTWMANRFIPWDIHEISLFDWWYPIGCPPAQDSSHHQDFFIFLGSGIPN